MGKNNKNRKKKMLAPSIIILLVFVVIFCVFKMKYKQYNPFWIKGKTIETIEAKYGEAEHIGSSNIYLYDLGPDKSIVMSTNQDLYLYMIVDENNVVTETDINIHPEG